MHPSRISFALVVLAAFLCADTASAQFVVFPKASELVAPNGRFVVRGAEREGPASDLVGNFHSLWLTELATGHSRKLCDYMGVAAVAWSGNDFLIVNQYVGRKTSRALVFSPTEAEDLVTLDQPRLVGLLPVELRPTLRETDRVFIEASAVEQGTLHFTVWGYGQHDPNGFRWRCTYAFVKGTASCAQNSTSH